MPKKSVRTPLRLGGGDKKPQPKTQKEIKTRQQEQIKKDGQQTTQATLDTSIRTNILTKPVTPLKPTPPRQEENKNNGTEPEAPSGNGGDDGEE